ncbi:MAG: cytochrome c biogenesis protein CcsA [Planctomycetales bacterium]|nr:cytochrome c biogenesis protein CcsA [Planctomycetales bacterium]
MDSGINMLCFSGSYVIALGLELSGLWTQVRLRRPMLLVAGGAGLVAHTWYLGRRIAEMPAAPLANQQDWYVLAAWALAIIYYSLKFYYPRSATGMFLLPAVLGLIGASLLVSTAPLSNSQGPRIWIQMHGIFLMLGTVVVLFGFLAGLMYLTQSYRLKHKLPTRSRFQLPSLEWLERVNSRSLGAATFLVGGGFFTGVLGRLAQEGDQNFVPWTDPVVVALAAMLLWLVVAEAFRLVYPAARQGRKVAYLTLAAFVFLILVLAAVTLEDSLHVGPELSENRDSIPRDPFPSLLGTAICQPADGGPR